MPKRNLIWIALIISVAAVTAWVTRSDRPSSTRSGEGRLDGVEEAYRMIQQRYYFQPDEQALRRGAVRGMVGKLDEYSTYVAPDDLQDFQSRLRGVEHGLGLVVEQAGERFCIVGPLLNSPAHRAGIDAGDELVAIAGEPLTGLDLSDVEQRLDCPAGGELELTVQREAGRRKDFTLKCGAFELESVVGLYRDDNGRWVHVIEPESGLAYVRIEEFVPDTGAKLREALQRSGPIAGLVLDLRGNPGGTLPAAVEVANEFLREGAIATCVSRDQPPRRYRAQSDGVLLDAPMVVLVNGETASAAEIVAGALQLHDRAVIVGGRTRGKGHMQTMLTLGDGLGQINLTTAEMLVGEDQSICRSDDGLDWGIDPHAGAAVDESSEQRTRLEPLWRRAAVLAAPRDGQADQATTAPASAPARDRAYAEFLFEDESLETALELLSDADRMEEILIRGAAQRSLAELEAEEARQAVAEEGEDEEQGNE